MYVSMHMDGIARLWLLSKFQSLMALPWVQFRDALLSRFAEQGRENVVAELTQLRQTGTVLEFQAKFEELMARVLEKWPLLDEGIFTDIFMGGLKIEPRDSINMHHPKTLDAAIRLARLQESVFNNLMPKGYSSYKPSQSYTPNFPITIYKPSTYSPSSYSQASTPTSPYRSATNSSPNYLTSPYSNLTSKNTTPLPFMATKSGPTSTFPTQAKTTYPTAPSSIKKLTPSEMQARRDKGLCYFCEEPYVFGHKCKRAQLFMLTTEEDEGNEVEFKQEGGEIQTMQNTEPAIDVGISIQAISGGTSYQTLILEGKCKKQPITILIDSGSTHNFLDPSIAKQLGCQVVPTHKLLVTVANGSSTNTNSMITDFQWSMQGETFSAEVRLLPLGGCDMVLGVQWLREVGPIGMDLKDMCFSIQYKGKVLKLQTKRDQLQFISGVAMHNYCTKWKCGVMA